MDESGRVKEQFLKKHQKHVISLAQGIGIDIGELFSTNAIFARSSSFAKLADESGYTVREWWQACWPVHQYMLDKVRPKLIITLGKGYSNSAFSLLHQVAGGPPIMQIGETNVHGGRTFSAPLPTRRRNQAWRYRGLPPFEEHNLPVQVVGVPHPSRYASGERLKHELREIIMKLNRD